MQHIALGGGGEFGPTIIEDNEAPTKETEIERERKRERKRDTKREEEKERERERERKRHRNKKTTHGDTEKVR